MSTILLIGAGRMGGALLKGWLSRKTLKIAIVEPKPHASLRRLCDARGIPLHARIEDAPARPSACIVALKPQVMKTEAARLKPIAESGAPMISIAAGTGIASLRKAWGREASIVRAMPNTPGAIGRGITALFAAPTATAADRKLAESLLSALGETLWVKREALIDAATAVSGSGPAYVFLLAETLAAAGAAEGLPAAVARRLARATVAGAGALLDTDPRDAAELRKDVTSPGGTTEAALEILMAKDGLARLMKRAVSAARRRARQLSA